MKIKAVMRQTLTHPDLIVRNPKTGQIDEAATKLKIQLLRNDYADKRINKAEFLQRRWQAVEPGYVHDHPDAYLLVGQGWEPADEECREAADAAGLLTDMAANNLKAIKLSRGQGTGQRAHDLSDAAADKLVETRAARIKPDAGKAA